MKKKILCFLFAALFIFSAVGCSANEAPNVDQSEKKPIVITGWGGDMTTNRWMETTLIPFIKETEGLDAVWIPSDISDILLKLENEKVSNAESEFDIVWINGENFAYAMENSLLNGPFLKELPNAKSYLDFSDPTNTLDFGLPTEGYEAPWGRAQFVLIADSAKVTTFPRSSAELKDYLTENPGAFTYPIATDFTGSAFIRTVLYDIVGYENLKDLPPDYDQVKASVMPAMDYLNEIKPLLWTGGEHYPPDVSQLDKLYQDGLIHFTMNYNSNTSYNQIKLGLWVDSSRTFLWDSGTPSNTNFLAISANTANYEGAKKVINAALSPEMQASQSQLEGRASTPVLDISKLTDDQLQLFDQQNQPNETALRSLLSVAELAEKSVAELSPELVVLIEQIWEEEVLYA